jgi:FkbM family methyltransferase
MVVDQNSALAVALCRHGWMVFLRGDNVIGRCLAKYGEWAELEIQFLCQFITPASVVLDVGANIGTHTLPFARGAACVYAFEPQPTIFHLLQTNIEKNGLTNVKLFNTGVSRTRGHLLMPCRNYAQSDNFGAVTFSQPGITGGGADGELVHSLAIDDLALSSCDLMKVDVEGMEFDVLVGAANTIERCRPIVYAECVYLEPGWECVKLMRAKAYRAFVKLTRAYNAHNVSADPEDIFNGTKEAAVFFVPEERSASLRAVLENTEDLFPVVSLEDLANRLVETTKLQEMKWTEVAQKAQLQQLTYEVQQYSAEAERLRQSLAERTTEVERLGQELSARAEEVDGLRRSLAEATEAAHLAQRLAVERAAESEQLAQELSAQAEEVDGLRHSLAEATEAAHLAQRLAVERAAESEQLAREADSMKAELARKSLEMAGMLNSRSWRVTAPLRVLGGRGRGLLRRLPRWPPRAFAQVAKRVMPQRYRLSSEVRIILHSGLFDVEFYLAQYPRVARRSTAVVKHYVSTGALRGLNPHPLFASAFYLECNPDVAAAGLNPLVHYLTYGAKEGRDPHPLFDSSFYLECNPDVAAAGLNPLVHYLTYGAKEGRDPNPLFDSSFYLEQYPDVAATGLNPLVHYLTHGAKEGRDPNPLFFSSWYLEELRRRKDSEISAELESVALTAPEAKQRRRKIPSPTRNQETVYAFTSICLNYVPKARVLAATLKEHNPHVRFCLLVNEPVPESVIDELDVFDEVAEVGDLSIPDKTQWIFKHTLVELCTGSKGFYMRELLARPDCKAVFYFDPDMAVFSNLQILLAELEHASILLTPHLTEPETTVEAVVDNEVCALQHGVYNLGFLGLKPSSEGCRFADWWQDRLEKFCVADIPHGLFTDQRWVDLAPAFFKDLAIIRHPGCNVATWNLTHRQVEGDFETGFTVNGQPLIFYHFSGFDSGAQEAMLNKYGSQMPAVHRLRRWYIDQTERPGDEWLKRLPWAYGFYRNGEPISAEQRRLYRQRVDLQQAFPDPFDTSNPHYNYLAWFKAEVSSHRPAGKSVSSYIHEVWSENPLVHFVSTRGSQGVRPNPYFDPLFYLESNPDVTAAGIDPLSHYLHVGVREGRDPSPEFDTAFYRSQVHDGTPLDNPLIHYFTTGQKLGLRISSLFDPVADARKVRALKRWCGVGRPLILLISHYGGGGTEKHVRDLATHLENRAQFLLISPIWRSPRKTIWVRTLDQFLDVRLVFDPVKQRQELVELLHTLGVCRVHIHHALGNEHYLADLIAALRLPFDFTVHDYYTLAPNPHLVGDDGRFLGDDLEAYEQVLLRNAVCQPLPQTLAAWCAAHEWLLRDAARVIVPSYDVAKRLQRHVPGLHPIVAAHPEGPIDMPTIRVRRLEAGDVLKIAVLGELAPQKGLRVFLECARLNTARGGKLSFQLIGYSEQGHAELRQAGVLVSGQYRDDELPEMLLRYAPDLLWYPAQCPETYSYTLSAGLRSGLPLVVSDIGSFPERVGGHPWTWIQPWDLEPEEWLAFFERIRQENFIAGLEPVAPGALNRPSAEFYGDEYLRVVETRPS